MVCDAVVRLVPESAVNVQKRSDLERLQQVYLDFVLQYRSSGQQAFEKTLDTAEKSYRAGAIDYLDYVQLLEQAQRQHSNYLTQLKGYHYTRLELLFLTL